MDLHILQILSSFFFSIVYDSMYEVSREVRFKNLAKSSNHHPYNKSQVRYGK